MTIITFTGHRPNKLGGYGEDVVERLTALIAEEISTLPGGDLRGITGMALGWDTAAAIAMLEMAVPYIAAVPFKGFEARWPIESRRRFEWLCDMADEVVIVSDGPYHPGLLHARNHWMVDRATEVWAMWNGDQRGGTYETISYAQKTRPDMPIHNFWGTYNSG